MFYWEREKRVFKAWMLRMSSTATPNPIYLAIRGSKLEPVPSGFQIEVMALIS